MWQLTKKNFGSGKYGPCQTSFPIKLLMLEVEL